MLKSPARCESDQRSVIVPWGAVECDSRIVHHTLSQKGVKTRPNNRDGKRIRTHRPSSRRVQDPDSLASRASQIGM